MGVDDSILSEIVRRILAVAAPDRIILFGSAANGTMRPDSDLDLLILEPDPQDTRDESLRIRWELDDLAFPVDVIVIPTRRFEETKNLIGGIAYPANKYGCSMNLQRELVAQWLERAEEDVALAVRVLEDNEPRFRRGVGFRAQQAAEKYLKALLAMNQIEIEKNHAIGRVLRRIAIAHPDLAASLQAADRLTPFAAESRYPGDLPDLLPGAEREAVELARHVRDAVLPLLEAYFAAGAE